MQNRPVPRIALNLDEAVISTGLGKSTIIGAIERGELPCKRIGPNGPGRRIVILCTSIEAWLAPDAPEISQTSAPAEASVRG